MYLNRNVRLSSRIRPLRITKSLTQSYQLKRFKGEIVKRFFRINSRRALSEFTGEITVFFGTDLSHVLNMQSTAVIALDKGLNLRNDEAMIHWDCNDIHIDI